MGKRYLWTPAQREIMRKLYPDTPTVELAARLGLSIDQVYREANRSGLKKSAAFLASGNSGQLLPGHKKGIQHRFQPGQKAWNKGLKGLPLGGAGRFAPGHVPSNYKPVGTVVVTSDGYLKIKFAEGMYNWKMLHQQTWEAQKGPVPPGHILVFKDRNRQNCDIDNLELITCEENMNRNSIHNLPEEIKEVIRIRAGIVRRINHKEQRDEK